VLAVEVSLISL